MNYIQAKRKVAVRVANEDSPQFQNWSSGTTLVKYKEADNFRFETSKPVTLEAFHGTSRGDRIGDYFSKKRATSGPMPYFTSSPELASDYAVKKNDTSLGSEPPNPADWFLVTTPEAKKPIKLVRAWESLPSNIKDAIRRNAPCVFMNDAGEIVFDEDHEDGLGNYDYELVQARRNGYGINPLKALIESWFTSGTLDDNERAFLTVLKLAGLPSNLITYDSPNDVYPAVFAVYIRMRKPIVTSDVPGDFIANLEDRASDERSMVLPQSVKLWDKKTLNAKGWLEYYRDKTLGKFAWTVLPTAVTDIAESLGYDGIIWTRASGGTESPVYIPFHETQIKSLTGNKGTFNDKRSLTSAVADQSASNFKALALALYAIVSVSRGVKLTVEAKDALLSEKLKPILSEVEGLKEAVSSALKNKKPDTVSVGNGMKAFVKDYKAWQKRNPAIEQLFAAFGLYLRAESKAAWNTLSNYSTAKVFPTWVSTPFVTNSNTRSQAEIKEDIASLVSKALSSKKHLHSLSVAQATKLKKLDPESYSKYLALRREMTASWKAQLQKTVHEYGQKLMPYEDAVEKLHQAGYEHSMPEGFTGLIDGSGHWYDAEGEEIDGVPSATMFPSVRMNTSGGGDWVFQSVRADGTAGGYFYLLKKKTANKQEKFEKVQDLEPRIDAVRQRWLALLKRFDPNNKDTVAALMLELVYEFSCRIGGKGNEADGKPTYGLSTLLVKHLTLRPSGFLLSYLGKDAVRQKHEFVAQDALGKHVMDCLRKLVEDKQPSDPLFTYNLKNGTKKYVTPSEVNRVWRECGAGSLSIHSVRTLKGTRIFNEEVDKLYEKRKSFKTSAEVLDAVKVAAMKVGKALGHVRRVNGGQQVTPATALSNYISPEAQAKVFEHYAQPLPTYLAKLLNQHRVESSRILAEAEAPTGDPVGDKHEVKPEKQTQTERSHEAPEGTTDKNKDAVPKQEDDTHEPSADKDEMQDEQPEEEDTQGNEAPAGKRQPVGRPDKEAPADEEPDASAGTEGEDDGNQPSDKYPYLRKSEVKKESKKEKNEYLPSDEEELGVQLDVHLLEEALTEGLSSITAGTDDEAHQKALKDTGYWGAAGAGCVFKSKKTGRYLLAHRSQYVLEPNTWGTWGGAIDSGEDPETAVRREVEEESGYTGPAEYRKLWTFKAPNGKFRYYNFLVIVPDEFTPELDWENQGYRWVAGGDWPKPMHPGLKALLDNVKL